MSSVKVCIVTGDGVNCERETMRAFEKAGANCHITHINEKVNLDDFHILAFPGGFSFGDELGSGKVFALKIEEVYGNEIKEFVAKGKPIIGICNGFQVLTKLGIFSTKDNPQLGLAHNESGQFINKWSALKVNGEKSIWLKGIKELFLPIRHGEGRFVAGNNGAKGSESFKSSGCDVLHYVDNPNGSMGDIAGIYDPTGLVFGLKPHPEAAVDKNLYPGGEIQGTLGLEIFKNAVNYVKERGTV